MEENFEKKSSKKITIIISLIVILVVVLGALYLNYMRKPEQIYSKAVEEIFKPLEDGANKRKAKLDMEMSLNMVSNDTDVIITNEVIKSIKLNSTTEMDLDKKIINENLKATFAGKEVVSADALIQDEKMYIYLNEIYSKFIEIPEEYMEGEDLSKIFETNADISEEDLIKDIKKVLLDEINSREFTKETTELNGEKVQKSTLRLTPKEVLEITVKMLEKLNEYQSTDELEELIKDLKTEIEYSEETENYIDISIYTKGLISEFVKADFVLVNVEYDEVIIMEITKNSENETKIKISLNEYSTKVEQADNVIEITISSEEDNKGTIKLKMYIEEDAATIVKIKYEINYDVEIEKRDTANSIVIDDLTDEDYAEINKNIEENEILNSILQQFMVTEEYELVY